MQDHGAGRFDAAQALYRRVLDDEPRHPDALHLLGVLQAQRGQHDGAAELIARAIAANPGEAMFHNNLGNVCVERSRFDEAEASYMRAIELDPARFDALNNLGVLLSRRGHGEGAEKLLLKVIELAPDFADARQNLANHYMRAGRMADAIQQCFDGLIVAPRSAALRRMLGVAYSTMGMKAEATAVYRTWLEAEPDNPVAAFHLSACTGEDLPERAPDAYVTRVFDAFARTFDAKLADLSYKAPELAFAALARRLAAPAKALDVLDAGCGTGLCGPLLAPYVRSLVGVDLSEGMLAKAAPRRVYDELVCGELVAFLESRAAAFDVVVSTDTLVYFGRLDDALAAAAAALRRGGWLFFTVEAHADVEGAPDFRLHEHGRYSHRRRYVEAALRRAGFDGSDIEPVVLRMEAGEPVDGWLVSARAATRSDKKENRGPMPEALQMELVTSAAEALRFKSMSAQEEMSRLFEFQIIAVSEDRTLLADDLLGTNVAVSLEVADDSKRWFHGIITGFGIEGVEGREFTYRITARPWAWLMTRSADVRIFQEMSTPDIVKEVFGEYTSTFVDELSGSYQPRTYCVQYRETDFNFVCRLMEEEGIFFYWRHAEDKHDLVLADASSTHVTVPGFAEIRYLEDDVAQAEVQAINDWHMRHEIQTGKLTLSDYNFETPSTSLLTTTMASSRSHGENEHEVYDYPGLYGAKADGDTRAQIRLDEASARFTRFTGQGNTPGLTAGTHFTLKDHPRDDQNADYLVLQTQIDMQQAGYEALDNGDTKFLCRFVAQAFADPFRPARTTRKPSVAGPQTALVVGAGDAGDIETDEYGRIKVQFHWDRLGQKNAESSCWLRVSSSWAGNGWGMISLPRIGQEVIVAFLEGDPDQPLVVGSVYNAEQLPPYELPANATVSTLKSRSKLGEADAFNELRFEDLAGSEYLLLHAQKDRLEFVEGTLKSNLGIGSGVGDEHRTVKQHRKEKIGGAHHLSVVGAVKQKFDDKFSLAVADNIQIKTDAKYSLKTGADFIAESGATISFKSSGDLHLKIGANIGAEAAQNVHIKGGTNIVIEAGTEITLKAGGSFITIGAAGVAIKGAQVMINSGGAAGSGSGASPEAPVDPEAPEDPLLPEDPLTHR